MPQNAKWTKWTRQMDKNGLDEIERFLYLCTHNLSL